MSPRHPAKRAQARQIVSDTVDLAYWWEAERSAARRDEAMRRLLVTASWCVVVLTVVVVGVTILDTLGGV